MSSKQLKGFRKILRLKSRKFLLELIEQLVKRELAKDLEVDTIRADLIEMQKRFERLLDTTSSLVTDNTFLESRVKHIRDQLHSN